VRHFAATIVDNKNRSIKRLEANIEIAVKNDI
jgi:hypothetical protein